ncbi:electron transport complex protein RnfB [Pseudomonas taetrolens]|uniref:(4Fe-4S)-binding protein n=1 Tax=Pseudomonas taetrolens TaxID=47884 RepID=A0A0J6GPP6_PSETA|nr:electron transport complex subunit RsxB [Pseudomonas taetrolens]KMM86641.1 (4Fe-4S)-binding protein [Pseudomonas taetrolens]SEB74270.1 electron transport complex protein RnfB [Pseudomonas taetrolens]SQF85265.1 RnfABCDGE type electron transport complex subunit B [Pseudomonas taetrolens]VEH48044.1 RnfABCDGE type electron transport complex subunit B [Pseudomonas taetrolens]
MSLIQRIDALLPQTQCGKCGHPGCKPYAQGIAQGEAINKCPPGGAETISALASLLKIPVVALDTERGTAPPQVAYIREAECIGCTKCIQACPIDAILGAAKLMHTVIIDECTGCDLCIAPCPVDCIEMRPLPESVIAVVGGLAHEAEQYQARTQKRDHARTRYERRTERLNHEEQQRLTERLVRTQRSAPVAGTSQNAEDMPLVVANPNDAALKKAKVTLAMARAQLNKSLKAFGHPPTRQQQAQLVLLQEQFESAEQALAKLESTSEVSAPAPVSNNAELKRAKIQLAMRRAELKKASAQAQSSSELTLLCDAVAAAELTLSTLEQSEA